MAWSLQKVRFRVAFWVKVIAPADRNALGSIFCIHQILKQFLNREMSLTRKRVFGWMLHSFLQPKVTRSHYQKPKLTLLISTA